MNEIVKYHNDMNTVALRKFNSLEMNIFISICSKMKEKNEEIIEFSFDKIKELAKIEGEYSIEKFGKMLDSVYEKLLKTSIKIGNDRRWVRFVLFTKYEIDLDKQTVTIQVHSEFKWVLNELTAKFTRFELEEYVDFKSSYTKEFYRRMKQFKTTGIWKISLKEFREQLDIPKSYATYDIDKAVLSPILKELKKEYKLKIKKIYSKNGVGRPKLSGFEFRFKPEEVEKKENKSKEIKEHKEIRIYNKNLDRIEEFNIISSFMKDNEIWLKLENKETKEEIYKQFNHPIHYTNFLLKYGK